MKCECVQRAEFNHRSTVDDRRSGNSSWLSVGGRVQPRVQTSARRDTRRFAAGGIEVANPFQRLLPGTDSVSANRLDHLRKAGFLLIGSPSDRRSNPPPNDMLDEWFVLELRSEWLHATNTPQFANLNTRYGSSCRGQLAAIAWINVAGKITF